ncbi:hypothetical protein [Actinopolymorpha pittospori]|uniref:Uncharacterized protein n=1 Tax=Actinopolymorpha pittospori TaxID=648752 RepID=A0A927N061_9ACTN|nr:hypothetical protein [Actinopolymorpha pittospori]MBE1610191.1 hypothetical protein [Actinopolymorpha pittospori]
MTYDLHLHGRRRKLPSTLGWAVGVAVGFAPFGAIVSAAVVAAFPSHSPHPWGSAVELVLGSVVAQVVAQLTGTGFGLLLRRAVLACLATIVCPAGSVAGAGCDRSIVTRVADALRIGQTPSGGHHDDRLVAALPRHGQPVGYRPQSGRDPEVQVPPNDRRITANAGSVVSLSLRSIQNAPEPSWREERVHDTSPTRLDLELVEHRTLDGHIQELTYRPTLH